MTFLNSMAQTLERAFMNTSISHTRQILLAQSARVLADAGISRARLEQGDHAWPWRDGLEAAPATERASERGRRERLARAADELARLDDRELADLGIGRGDVERAVRFGRPGIEYPDADHALAGGPDARSLDARCTAVNHACVDLTALDGDEPDDDGEETTPRRRAA